MSTQISLSRRSRIRPVSNPNVTIPRHRSPSPETTPRALLVGHAYSPDLRRAGLDLIEKFKKNKKSAAALKKGGERELDRFPSRIGPRGSRESVVELHVLILKEGDRDKDDDEVTTSRSMILSQFRNAGASVQLHLLPITSHRLSLGSTSSTVRTALARSLESGTLGQAVSGGLDGAAFVCLTSDNAQEGEAFKSFIEGMESVFSSSSTSSGSSSNPPAPVKTTPPFITIYLPKHAYLSDFDLDLPEVEIKAVQVLRSAAEQFENASSSHRNSLPLPSPSGGRGHSRQKSWEGPLLATSTDPYRRQTFMPSSSNIAPRPMGENVELGASTKPLLLRPAPGAGAATLAMRLSIDTSVGGGHDIVMRVTEAQTPIKGPQEGLRPLLLHPPSSSGVSTRSRSPTPSLSASFGSSEGSSSLRSMNSLRSTLPPPGLPRARASFGAQERQKLHVEIPSSVATPKSAPALQSSFSPDSTPSQTPLTPAEKEGLLAQFTPSKHSPICRIPYKKMERTETTLVGVEGPEGWDNESRSIQNLLKARVERGEKARGGPMVV
ncbi:hypothetical protein P7C70_g7534, partial [Phenoliferia sp. Uapishka_3]